MTNREWLNTLSNEDFAKWCLSEECFEWLGGYKTKIIEPTPKLETLRRNYTSSYDSLIKWLDEERINNE